MQQPGQPPAGYAYPYPQRPPSQLQMGGGLWGIILVVFGGLLSLIGLILVLVADDLNPVYTGQGLLIGGLVSLGLWLHIQAALFKKP
jgi:hypothetical protein